MTAVAEAIPGSYAGTDGGGIAGCKGQVVALPHMVEMDI